MRYRVYAGAIRQEIEMDVEDMGPITKDGITIEGPFQVRATWHLSVDMDGKPGVTVLVIGHLMGEDIGVLKSFEFNRRDPGFPDSLVNFVDGFKPDFHEDMQLPTRAWGSL